ncbi:MAG TPA: hypothetical protein ENI96_00865 [Sedimenticola thiotaurini]|uniref:Uncharacterized protein n=1 Tax=Sedimenticola thiotaurini TaxID=1543721 RepID=A0A831RKA1_9GAMM|nr:hypothetical protein [Sedimenticola thiotaurini]
MSSTASKAAGRGGRTHRQTATGSGSHKHRYSRSQRKIIRLLITSWILGGLLFVVILVWIITSMKLSSLNGDLLLEQARTREQAQQNRQLQASNKQLRATIDRLEQEQAELVAGRIPRLRPLKFDVTIPIEQEYFRNINFTLTGTTHRRRYEYRVVMHNGGSANVEPDVTLFLFDELGIEVGKARLTSGGNDTEEEKNPLLPGETRSYSNEIRLDREATPKYFLVDVR